MAEKVLLEWRDIANFDRRIVEDTENGTRGIQYRPVNGTYWIDYADNPITITGGELAPKERSEPAFDDIRELRERVEKLERAFEDVRNNAVAAPAQQDVELPCTVEDCKNGNVIVRMYEESGVIGIRQNRDFVYVKKDGIERLAAALMKAAKLAREK